jgi:hypothetical protein
MNKPLPCPFPLLSEGRRSSLLQDRDLIQDRQQPLEADIGDLRGPTVSDDGRVQAVAVINLDPVGDALACLGYRIVTHQEVGL